MFIWTTCAILSGLLALFSYGGACAAYTSDVFAPSGVIFAITALGASAMFLISLHNVGGKRALRLGYLVPLLLFVSITTVLTSGDQATVLTIGGAVCAIYLLWIILKELLVTNLLQLIIWPGLILSLATPTVEWHRAFWFNVAIFGALKFNEGQRRKREEVTLLAVAKEIASAVGQHYRDKN
jgi:hypothetical protein